MNKKMKTYQPPVTTVTGLCTESFICASMRVILATDPFDTAPNLNGLTDMEYNGVVSEEF